MDLRQRLLRHRKDNRLIVAALTVLLLVFTAAFYLLQRNRDLPGFLVTNRVLLFVLWYANVVLILTVLFVLLRNVFKLVLERRHRLLGSNFKFKLVATYVGLSLIPVLLLFAIATELLQGSVERWFNTPLKPVLEQGNAVAQALYDQIERTGRRDATWVLGAVRRFDLHDAADRPRLNRRLQAPARRARARGAGGLRGDRVRARGDRLAGRHLRPAGAGAGLPGGGGAEGRGDPHGGGAGQPRPAAVDRDLRPRPLGRGAGVSGRDGRDGHDRSSGPATADDRGGRRHAARPGARRAAPEPGAGLPELPPARGAEGGPAGEPPAGLPDGDAADPARLVLGGPGARPPGDGADPGARRGDAADLRRRPRPPGGGRRRRRAGGAGRLLQPHDRRSCSRTRSCWSAATASWWRPTRAWPRNGRCSPRCCATSRRACCRSMPRGGSSPATAPPC